MSRAMRLGVALACLARPCYGGNSFVMPDGLSRSPAVTLHCTLDGITAVPCGVQAQPLVVTAPAGAATASNQAAEIVAQQALQAAVGSQADTAYPGTGAGSMAALLKGLVGLLANGVVATPMGGQPVSRSITIVAQQNTILFAANPTRHYLAFQAPPGVAIWVNMLGGIAGPNFVDCAYFAAGTFYESGAFVNRGSITVYSPVATAIAAWEG